MLIVTRGKRNVFQYPYQENVRYTLQRITGVIAFAFILWHVFQMHGWFHFAWWSEYVTKPLGGAQFDPLHAPATAAAVLQASNLVTVLYIVGVLACVYHLADGLWTAGITWGVWTSPRAQLRARAPCTALGVVLLIVGMAAIYGMQKVPLPPSGERSALLERPSTAAQAPEEATIAETAAKAFGRDQ
jgi:succinate dehydrogenase / fumarate reductase cytochrome b subunit